MKPAIHAACWQSFIVLWVLIFRLNRVTNIVPLQTLDPYQLEGLTWTLADTQHRPSLEDFCWALVLSVCTLDVSCMPDQISFILTFYNKIFQTLLQLSSAADVIPFYSFCILSYINFEGNKKNLTKNFLIVDSSFSFNLPFMWHKNITLQALRPLCLKTFKLIKTFICPEKI